MRSEAPIRLTRYRGSLRQPAHAHGAAHLSLVLAGAFQEEFSRGDITFQSGRVALRPEGMRHAGTFSPNGALILTCAAPAYAPRFAAPYWSAPLPHKHLRALIPLLLAGNGESGDAVWDLIAIAYDTPARAAPSPWISAVRDHLLEAPASASLARIAEDSGRHRVHLTRAFLAAFGETPSVFRRRAMLDRALCEMACGESSAAAAADAGFSDQSHFNRVCRDIYGATPGQIRQAVEVSHRTKSSVRVAHAAACAKDARG